MRATEPNYDVSSILDLAWTVDDLVIEINGVPVPQKDVLTYEILWEGPSLRGILSFEDHNDVLKESVMKDAPEGTPMTNVRVVYTSQKGSKAGKEVEFDKIYLGKNIQKSQDKVPTVTIALQDTLNAKLESSYISKTYSEMKPSEMIEKMFKDFDIEETINFVKREVEEVIVDDIITPLSTAAKDVFQNTLGENGFNICLDKFGIDIFPDEAGADDKAISTNETFYYRPNDRVRRDQIINYEVNGINYDALTSSSTSITSTVAREMGNENMSTETELTEHGNKTKIAGRKTGELSPTHGVKTSADYNPDSLRKSLQTAQTCKIWVPGWNGNRMNKKVNVELPKTSSVNQDTNDELFTGEWIVYKTRDKIINSYFVQELFLRRIGTA